MAKNSTITKILLYPYLVMLIGKFNLMIDAQPLFNMFDPNFITYNS